MTWEQIKREKRKEKSERGRIDEKKHKDKKVKWGIDNEWKDGMVRRENKWNKEIEENENEFTLTEEKRQTDDRVWDEKKSKRGKRNSISSTDKDTRKDGRRVNTKRNWLGEQTRDKT